MIRGKYSMHRQNRENRLKKYVGIHPSKYSLTPLIIVAYSIIAKYSFLCGNIHVSKSEPAYSKGGSRMYMSKLTASSSNNKWRLLFNNNCCYITCRRTARGKLCCHKTR